LQWKYFLPFPFREFRGKKIATESGAALTEELPQLLFNY